ncbi:Transposable element tcb2 transposase [Caligus rogercresseyi]|uniref:Transposable element tcb2 transposase n=1 Tax=Caligus rogercresseyi TaxID=217165 RepID=A0A7T8GWT5_CALRO|nr:Transposable element tcb2 transposase [Caligus rogercresseyi]
MPRHFFGPKEKVNTEIYFNVLKTVVVPWMDSQDSAPAHKAKLVQSWLKKNVLNFQHLAPQQPRPELMRLLLVGKLEREVCATHHSNVASLKTSIKSEMDKLDPSEVSMASGRFRRRLEDIIEAEAIE